MLLYLDWLVDFVGIDDAPMQVVDYGLVADFDMLGNEGLYLLADFVVGHHIAQEFVDLCRGHYPARGLVEVDIDQVDAATVHTRPLFAIRHQQVFGQAPVEEGTRIVDCRHGQVGELLHGGVWFLSRGHGPVLGVLIYEDAHGLAGAHVVGKVAPGQQHLGTFVVATRKVGAKLYHAADYKLLISSYFNHCSVSYVG